MYTVAVRRSFIAQHFLVGGDWGKENEKHSHPYLVEVSLEGDRLDEHGYLSDIVGLEALVDGALDILRDRTLNDLPEFAGLNPSIERLADFFCQRILKGMDDPAIRAICVKVWENDNAWASCRQDLP